MKLAPGRLHHKPELFFGLVSPIGVGGGTLTDCLATALKEVGYSTKDIRLINLLRKRVEYLKDGRLGPLRSMQRYRNEADRYDRFIKAGNHFCQLMGGIADHQIPEPSAKGQDALVALAIDRICEYREFFWKDNPDLRAGYLGDELTPREEPSKQQLQEYPWQFAALDGQAYILRSLKRPGEVDRLRRIYGDGFLLISAHMPHADRVDALSRKIASSDFRFNPDRARYEAERLIEIDQDEEGVPFGQNVREAYAKADFFIDARQTPDIILTQLTRFIRTLFNHQFYTPTRDEQGMAFAFLASLRSSHISRQVGASITTPTGSVVAVGCNEVPMAGGGAYWTGDEGDARDFQQKKNTSLEVRREVVGDILQRLADMKWLKDELAEEFHQRGDDFLDDAVRHPRLKEAKAMDAIEYDRSVHAEMAAIMHAAQIGVSVGGCTLYTTTFPCHNCARHIVAAGIRRVVYIHPYEKSLTQRLHGDAVGIDLSRETGATRVRFDPFVGIAPTLYSEFFAMGNRHGEGERWRRFAKWRPERASPRLKGDPLRYTEDEEAAREWLLKRLEAKRLVYRRESEDDD